MSLENFGGKYSSKVLAKFNLSDRFFALSVEEWENNKEFQITNKIFSALAVTNDNSERGIALLQEFSGFLTKDEEQLQYILQVVADHRKRYTEAHKQVLLPLK